MVESRRSAAGIGRRLLAALCSLVLACALLPAAAVPARADDAVLVLKARNANSSAEATVLKSFTQSDIDALEQHAPLAYAYGQSTGAKVYVTENYVPLDALISKAGGSPYWSSGSSLEFTVSGGLAYGKDTFDYSDVEQARYFYPNLALTENGSFEWVSDGAVSAPAVIAFTGASMTMSSGMVAQDAVDALAGVQNGNGMPRYFSGVSESDFASNALTAGHKSPQGVEAITVVYNGPSDPAPAPTPDPTPAPEPTPGPSPDAATRSLRLAVRPANGTVSVADASGAKVPVGADGSYTLARDAAYTVTVSAPGHKTQTLDVAAGTGNYAASVTLEPEAAPTPGTNRAHARSRVKKGQVVESGSGASKARYRIVSVAGAKGSGKVFYRSCARGKFAESATVPASVRIAGRSYRVTGISRGAFKGHKKLATVKVASKSLAKALVRGSLKGSKVKTVKVPKSKRTVYKKAFSKKNCGRSVRVR